MRFPVSLHISLSPSDLRHARHLLPHQLRTLASHVEEIVLTVDSGAHSPPDLAPFIELTAPFREACTNWQIRPADHSLARRRELGFSFFGRHRPVPHRTYRRGPCLAYFDGWNATNQPYLFHLDSDIFLGGDFGSWMDSSIRLIQTDPCIFACNPLPGPPRIDGTLNQSDLGAHPAIPGSHRFSTFTSRLFLVRRSDLIGSRRPLPWKPANLRNRLRAHLEGLPRLDLPENLLTRRMRHLGQFRMDHPGAGSPAFSLHPPHRNEDFYRRLPELVARAESDDYPAAQRGCYDINEALIDWSPQISALCRRRWWRVPLERLRSR